MFYALPSPLKDVFLCASVFHYVSFRAMAALLTAFAITLIGGGWFIAIGSNFFKSKAREHTPESHRSKDDMPTMGGIFMIAGIIITTLIWADLANPMVWIMLGCMIGFGLIGFADDWKKIRTGRGISARSKFIAQWSVAAAISILLVYVIPIKTNIVFPFFKNVCPDVGILFIPWAMFILVSCSNAVNLTDGLDGLAISSLLPNFALFSLVAYLAGHIPLASYLYIPFAGSAEVAVLGATFIGTSLGFLWYNAYPAQIFMGDVGSLALGACLALMALMAKQEFLLLISGGLFVLETVSVLLQVFVFKRWKKRIFKMAPLHHHFELMGWPEAKITTRFGIISLILCLGALITLKLR